MKQTNKKREKKKQKRILIQAQSKVVAKSACNLALFFVFAVKQGFSHAYSITYHLETP